MPPKQTGKFKCSKCGKTFAMAMHLGRHMTTIHGQASKATRSKPGAKIGARTRGRVGRPRGVVARLGLRDMPLDELAEVIGAAKEEGKRRVAEIRQVLLSTSPHSVGRPAGRKAVGSPTAPAKPGRRARRKFKVSGTESIMAFVTKMGTKGATTAEIVNNWKRQGRSGDGYTILGELVKAKRLKREKITGAKGSRYTAA